jgi:hypothetical protein
MKKKKQPELTPRQKLYKEIYDKVYNYPTKYPEGFIKSEIDDLIKDYPDFDMNKYYDAMMGNTCHMSKDNELIMYHCDVEHGLRCGIEKRALTLDEWD